jgi:hypothetical protein
MNSSDVPPSPWYSGAGMEVRGSPAASILSGHWLIQKAVSLSIQ